MSKDPNGESKYTNLILGLLFLSLFILGIIAGTAH